TAQLRALEAYVNRNLNSASANFLLAYHYLVQGNFDAARERFQAVASLQPKDQVSTSFVKALTKPAPADQQPAPATAVAPQTTARAVARKPAAAAAPRPAPTRRGRAAEPPQPQRPRAPPPPPPPPADMAGTWKSQPAPDLSIALTLQEGGTFTWDVTSKGQTQ